MQNEVKLGATCPFYHRRKPMELDRQPAVLMNRDTLHSFTIIDASHAATVSEAAPGLSAGFPCIFS
jgi:hypothetical protein